MSDSLADFIYRLDMLRTNSKTDQRDKIALTLAIQMANEDNNTDGAMAFLQSYLLSQGRESDDGTFNPKS